MVYLTQLETSLRLVEKKESKSLICEQTELCPRAVTKTPNVTTEGNAMTDELNSKKNCKLGSKQYTAIGHSFYQKGICSDGSHRNKFLVQFITVISYFSLISTHCCHYLLTTE